MAYSNSRINTIDEYIASFPDEVKRKLNTLRRLVKEEAPQAREAIKYRMPTFVLNGNLLHFAAFSNHIGLYPTPSAIEEFKQELSQYKTTKGSIRIPHDKPLPLDLIRKIVRLRVKEAAGDRKK